MVHTTVTKKVVVLCAFVAYFLAVIKEERIRIDARLKEKDSFILTLII
jgi:hypothetical protein